MKLETLNRTSLTWLYTETLTIFTFGLRTFGHMNTDYNIDIVAHPTNVSYLHSEWVAVETQHLNFDDSCWL